jgi:preprotein translocase subunit YajC
MVFTDSTGVVVLTATLAQAEGAPAASQAPAQPNVPGAVVPGNGEGAAGGTLVTPGTGTSGSGQGSTGTSNPMGPFLWILMIGLAVMIFTTSRAGRKQKKEREALLASVKRNDRVQTVGGIIGSVIELTDTEMVLRVDESSNTRIRFSRSALQQVLRESKEPGRADVELKPKNEPATVR